MLFWRIVNLLFSSLICKFRAILHVVPEVFANLLVMSDKLIVHAMLCVFFFPKITIYKKETISVISNAKSCKPAYAVRII